VFAFIEQNRVFDYTNLLNVNFLPQKSRGIRVSRQGGIYFSDDFVHQGDHMFLQVGEPVPHDGDDISTDIGAIENGYISITPITALMTDVSAYEKLRSSDP